MKTKIGSAVSMAVVALATAGLMRLTSPAAPPAAVAPVPAAALERAPVVRFEQNLARAGAQLALAAKAGAAPAGPDDEGTPAGDLREAETARAQAAKEASYYDGFDRLIEGGGGAAVAAQLRKNIESAKRLTGQAAPPALESAAIACAPTVCRVRLRIGDPKQIVQVAHVLGHGMGGLSMRPASGGEAVYYVAAADHPLPNLDL